MKDRARPDRGYVNPTALPKGPNGRALCRYCQAEVPPGKRTFCGPACVHEWKVRSNPGYAATCVLARDCGVCAACGLDCVITLQLLKRLRSEERLERYGARLLPLNCALPADTTMPRFRARLDELGITKGRRLLINRLWEMDHILPVSEGGGACGLDNLRTLCWACHAKETAKLAARRALSKRGSDAK